MKRTCLGYVALFLALGLLGGAVLFLLLPPLPKGYETPFIARLIPALGFGLGCALFVTIAISVLKDTRERFRNRAQLGENVMISVPANGEKAVACGPLIADGPLLIAPFTRTACVSYWYQVKHTSGGSRSGDVIDAWGYALTPSHIETPWGAVRLLSYTEFDFTARPLADPEARKGAIAYLAATPLVFQGLETMSESFHAVKALMADDDGTVRGDFGSVPPELATEKYRLYEKVVVDRDPVCAFGTWNEDRRGLLPDPISAIFFPVRVIKGTAPEVRHALLMGAIGNLCGAAVLLAIAAAGVWAFFRFQLEFI